MTKFPFSEKIIKILLSQGFLSEVKKGAIKNSPMNNKLLLFLLDEKKYLLEH